MNWLKQIGAYVPYNEQEVIDQRAMVQYLNHCSNALTRENAIAHVTVSSWIVNRDHSKVLMIYHNIMDRWAWTGGHADGEKDLLGVAIREAKEETGLHDVKAVDENIYSIEILPVSAHWRRGEYVNAHLHLNVSFLLEADEQDVLRVKEDENRAVRWFALEEVLSLIEDTQDRLLYEKLIHKLKHIED